MLLTVLAPKVKIRRGPGISAGILRDAIIGQQFKASQVIDSPKSPEQWAKIVLEDQQQINAYICARLPSGEVLCEVSNAPAGPGDSADFQRGFRAGVEHVLRWVSAERAKLE